MPDSPPPAASLTFVKWAFLAGLFSVAATIVVLILIFRDPAPRLTKSGLAEAQAKWLAHSSSHYDMHVQAVGYSTDTYELQVRDGELSAVTFNGHPSTRPESFHAWTIQGMFAVMSRDIDREERAAAGKAAPGEGRLSLRAEFDPQIGYPIRYLRSDRATACTSSWTIKSITFPKGPTP